MRPRTEELLYYLMWSAERLMCPTFRNLTDSFESWAYRNGLLRQIERLQVLGFVERDGPAGRHPSGPAEPDRIYRLTRPGLVCALGGRDPVSAWDHAWDGRWRLVIFDLPVQRNTDRDRLRSALRVRGFGRLQWSVWISPHPLRDLESGHVGETIDVSSLILMEAAPCGGETNEEIVASAWDFNRINGAYNRCLNLLDRRPRLSVRSMEAAEGLRSWAARERRAWREAVSLDPLLPTCLLPHDYLGQRTWQRRIEALGKVRRQIENFSVSELPRREPPLVVQARCDPTEGSAARLWKSEMG